MLDRFLNTVERFGNKLNNICSILLFSTLFIMLLSCALSFVDLNLSLNNKPLAINNMLGRDNLIALLENIVVNFITFPPLSLTIVLTLAVAIGDKSQFINTLVKKLLNITSQKYLTHTLLFISIIFHIASYSAYIIVIPISAYIYYRVGRHPLSGIATAFAGLAGAYTASFIPSTLDTILQGFTQKSAEIIDKDIQISILCNYFFSFVSTFVVIIVCSYITDNVMEKRFVKLYKINANIDTKDETKFNKELKALEHKSFYIAISLFFFMLIALILSMLSSNSILKDAQGSLISKDAPLMQGIVAILFLFIALPSLVYGFLSKNFKSTTCVVKAMEQGLVSLRGFIVFCFFASNFLYVFSKSNLASAIALYGATVLKDLNLHPLVTLSFILIFTAFLNIFITSSVSKWAILSSIFVPMLMLVDIDAAFTQAAFRISDSALNIITPLFPFYPLIYSYGQKYCSSIGFGTISAMMLPYSLALLISLSVLLFIFYILNIPLGL